jgi:hypothetical protein
MSNLNSSSTTTSLNSLPPAPPATPASSFGSNITDSFNKLTSTVTEAASDLTERASDTASSLTNQASDAVSSGINTLNNDVSSLTGTEPEQPVIMEEPVNQPLSEVVSAETLNNIPSTETLNNIPSAETFGPTKVTRKRCRNGTRKDKNGDCQPKQAKQTKHRKGSVKVHNMTAKYHELKLENNILIKQQKKAINLTKKLMSFLTLQ